MEMLVAERMIDPMSIILVLLAAVLLPLACVRYGVGTGTGAPAILGGVRGDKAPKSFAR